MTEVSTDDRPGQHGPRCLQGVWMKVDISKKEYRALLDMLGIANWVLHAHRDVDAPRTAAYRELEQKFFKLAADFGLADLFEYDEELVERLAMRDVLSHIGQREFHEMEVEERLNKLDAAIEIYEDEFAKNGLNRLAIDF